jgi:hypothetical protein
MDPTKPDILIASMVQRIGSAGAIPVPAAWTASSRRRRRQDLEGN